jgi:hypothetical protein
MEGHFLWHDDFMNAAGMETTRKNLGCSSYPPFLFILSMFGPSQWRVRGLIGLHHQWLRNVKKITKNLSQDSLTWINSSLEREYHS